MAYAMVIEISYVVSRALHRHVIEHVTTNGSNKSSLQICHLGTLLDTSSDKGVPFNLCQPQFPVWRMFKKNMLYHFLHAKNQLV